MNDERATDQHPAPVARPALFPRRGDDADAAPIAVALQDMPLVDAGDVVVDPGASRRRRPAPRPGGSPDASGAPSRPERGEDQAGELVIDLLDALESLVVNGRRFPFSAAVMVNEDEALDYIDRARAALPEDVKQARVVADRQRELVAAAESRAADLIAAAHAQAEALVAGGAGEADRVVAAAHSEAERVLRTASEHASALVSAHAVTAAAESRARDIAAASAEDAASQRAQADAYARSLLTELSAQIEKALSQVHRGLEVLPGSPPPPQGDAPRRSRR
ncbi:MAG TPA: hypothetical protein VFO60_07450 [Candidatus Dormibacteraeota bacterium]|nr:hypothetical protein [Candidatus Dormibacteraeota bacterium]